MKFILAIVLSMALATVGCTTSWVTTVDTILVAAAPALTNILEIIAIANGVPVNSALVNKIATDAGLIKTLSADFQKASATAGPGVCAQLQGAIGAYQADQALVMQAAQVSDVNTQNKIVVLSELVAGTVQTVLALVPPCSPTAAPAKMTVASSLRLSTFVSTYNSVLVAKTHNPAVDAATPKLVIHQHSKFVRKVSFGRLN